jgi:hypothetical protein
MILSQRQARSAISIPHRRGSRGGWGTLKRLSADYTDYADEIQRIETLDLIIAFS